MKDRVIAQAGMAIAAACLTANGAAAQVAPQETGQRFAVEGAGNLDCATFLVAREDRGSAEYQRFIGFAEGYLSAANLYEPSTFDLSPWHNAAAFDLILNEHCSTHQDEKIASVLQRMVLSFRPVRVAEYSPMLEVGSGEYRAYVYETILRRAQAALGQRGYYAGPEDARYTPEMRESLLSFQRDQNLVETGVPDTATLWVLLNP